MSYNTVEYSFKTLHIIRLRYSLSYGSFVLIPLLPVTRLPTLRTLRLFTSLLKITSEVGYPFIFFHRFLTYHIDSRFSVETDSPLHGTNVLRADWYDLFDYPNNYFFKDAKRIIIIHNKNNTYRYRYIMMS